MERTRLRLPLVVAAVLALATAGCLGLGGEAGGGDHGSDEGPPGDDGGGEGDGDDGGSGEDLGFFDGSTDPIEEAAGTSEYENATAGFRLLVPDGWSQLGDTPLWYVGPDPGIDSPRRNLNVVVGTAGGLSQDAYVESNVEQVRQVMGAQDVRLEAAVLGGDDATRVAFDGTFRGLELTWVQLVAVHGDHAYTVTYTFPQGEDPGHQEELATALESFSFLETQAPVDELGNETGVGI